MKVWGSRIDQNEGLELQGGGILGNDHTWLGPGWDLAGTWLGPGWDLGGTWGGCGPPLPAGVFQLLPSVLSPRKEVSRISWSEQRGLDVPISELNTVGEVENPGPG